MNTPAHLLIGTAAFGKAGAKSITAGAAFGAIAPDLSLYLLAGTSIFLLGIPAETVFGEYYFSDAWQSIFAVDNSFVVWGVLLILALLLRQPWAIALTAAALLHLCLDFPLHNDDARPHFWPVTDWVFVSPVSYWDVDHYGALMVPVGLVASGVAAVILWRRYRSVVGRGLIAVVALAELVPAFMWLTMFR